MATKVTDAVSKLVDILEDFSPEERARIVRAVFALFSDVPAQASIANATVAFVPDSMAQGVQLPVAAQRWMSTYKMTIEQLSQIFDIGEGGVATIAADVPGKDKKTKTLNAYIITGLRNFLASGSQEFDDKEARTFCRDLGVFSQSNHSTYLKERGNELASTSDGNWKLTQPGLKRGADLVHEIIGE